MHSVEVLEICSRVEKEGPPLCLLSEQVQSLTPGNNDSNWNLFTGWVLVMHMSISWHPQLEWKETLVKSYVHKSVKSISPLEMCFATQLWMHLTSTNHINWSKYLSTGCIRAKDGRVVQLYAELSTSSRRAFVTQRQTCHRGCSS